MLSSKEATTTRLLEKLRVVFLRRHTLSDNIKYAITLFLAVSFFTGIALAVITLQKEPAIKKQMAAADRFHKNMNGVVWDRQTGLEWYAGPDQDISWRDAVLWVECLKVAGGGWRMPQVDELRGLYLEDNGGRNLTPLLATTCLSVWSGDKCDELEDCAQGVNFDSGGVGVFGAKRRNVINARVFAVRPRK